MSRLASRGAAFPRCQVDRNAGAPTCLGPVPRMMLRADGKALSAFPARWKAAALLGHRGVAAVTVPTLRRPRQRTSEAHPKGRNTSAAGNASGREWLRRRPPTPRRRCPQASRVRQGPHPDHPLPEAHGAVRRPASRTHGGCDLAASGRRAADLIGQPLAQYGEAEDHLAVPQDRPRDRVSRLPEPRVERLRLRGELPDPLEERKLLAVRPRRALQADPGISKTPPQDDLLPDLLRHTVGEALEVARRETAAPRSARRGTPRFETEPPWPPPPRRSARLIDRRRLRGA